VNTLRRPAIGRIAMAFALVASGFFAGPLAAADPGKIVVQVDKPGATLGPLFYGLMTEEINFSYEGGLYGELIQNRIFLNPTDGAAYPPQGARGTPPPVTAPNGSTTSWSVVTSDGSTGDMAIDPSDPINTVALTHSLKLTIGKVAAGGRVGVANKGFWGVPAKPNSTYSCSFYAKGGAGFSGPLTITIESNDGKTVYATGKVNAITDKWAKYNLTLKTGQITATKDARFVISGASAGTFNVNLVSLFPPTYKERTGAALGERPHTGFRPDLMKLLDEMKPGFLRFPGGNYLEGLELAHRFDFKTTLGPWEQRPGHMSPWRYRSSDGMGLLEFLEWAEELNIEPVLGVYAGLNLNGTTQTGDALKPYVQEALDQIEYITGATTTTWGARRAKDGHPAPFKMTYVEVGNEDSLSGGTATYRGPQGRFAMFYDAIKAKYPNLQVIATTDPGVKHDVIDEHLYMNFNSALGNAHMYDPDRRPRENAPKVFVGEWATRDNLPTPSFHAALTDAAFLTGLERNADLVVMSCYAPLFVNVSDIGGPTRSQQWATNLIGYDALNSFGSPSYYVQKMFFNNKGDVTLSISVTPQTGPGAAAAAVSAAVPAGPPAAPAPAAAGAPAAGGRGRGRGGAASPTRTLLASSTRDQLTGEVIVKVVNAAETAQQIEISLEGVTTIGKTAKVETLVGGLTDVNSIAEPMKVAPKSSTIDNAGTKFVREFPGNSVSIIRLSTR
jgi:alpha-L-arabinofuranosidase